MKLFGYKIVSSKVYDSMVGADSKTRDVINTLKEKLSDMTANADACRSNLNMSKDALRTANYTAEDNMKMLKEVTLERDVAHVYSKQLKKDIEILKAKKKPVKKVKKKRVSL